MMLGLLAFFAGLGLIGLMITCGYLGKILVELRALRTIARVTSAMWEEFHGLRRQLTESSDGPEAGYIYRLERTADQTRRAVEDCRKLMETIPTQTSILIGLEGVLVAPERRFRVPDDELEKN